MYKCECSKFRLCSIEKKTFSNLFFSQLADANGLSSCFEALSQLSDLVQPIEDEDDESNVLLTSPPLIDALLCECYYFQLSTQPVWEALTFLYMRKYLSQQLSPNVIIMPSRGRVMCSALHLPNLSRCHGLVGRYSPFTFVF